MDFARLQRKLVLRLTSPSEYLRVVGRHWLLLFVVTTLGILIGLKVVHDEPAIYQARATLQLNPNEPLVEPGSRSPPQRLERSSFINDQISVLQSDTVLLTLVRALEDARDSQDDHPSAVGVRSEAEGGNRLGRIREVYRDLKSQALGMIDSLRPPPTGPEEEVRRQRAVRQFRMRSRVIPEKNSHNVELLVVGTRRERLVRELETWISSYRQRIEDFTEESLKRFLTERMEYWNGIIDEKRKVLERFHAQNPDVSKTMQKIIQEQVIRQRIFLDGLQNQLTSPYGGFPAPQPPPLVRSAEEEIGIESKLREKKLDLQLQRIELLGDFAETSRPVRSFDEKIRRVEQSLESLEASGTVVSSAEGSGRSYLIEALRESIEEATINLEDLHRRLVDIDARMAEFEELQTDYQYAQDKLRGYERSMDWSREFTQGQKLVQVQVWDRPTAGTEPINSTKGIKVAYGGVAGLAVGFVMAFLREFFAAKIRCRRDVAEELGLRVIGVVPSE